MKKSKPEKDQQQPAGKKRSRILLRLLLYPVVAVLALTLGAVGSLQTAKVRNLVKGYIQQTAARNLRADLQIGNVSGTLLFDISLEQVRISHKGQQIMAAQRLSLSYFLPLLLTRVLSLTEIEIEKLALNLVIEKDGRLNLAALVPAPAVETSQPAAPLSLPFSILVSRASLAEAQVVLTDRREGAAPERRIRNIRLTAGLKLSPRAAAAIRIMDLGFSIDRPAIRLERLTGRAEYFPDNGRLELQDFRLRLPESDLSVNGSLVSDPDGLTFDMRTVLKTLSVSELGRILEIPSLDGGRLTGTLEVKGTPERFFHQARLEMDGMAVSSRGDIVNPGHESLGLDVLASLRHLNPAALPLKPLRGISGDISSEIRLQGTDLIGPGRRARLSVNIKPSRIAGRELSGGRIEALLDAGGMVLKDSFLAGTWGSVSVRKALAGVFGSSPSGRLSLEASVKDLNPAGSGLTDLSGKINLDLAASAVLRRWPDGGLVPAAATAEVSAVIGPSQVRAAHIRSGHIQANWNGRDVDIKRAELYGDDGRFTVSGQLTPGSRSSRLQFAADLSDLRKVACLAMKFMPHRPPPVDCSDLVGRVSISGNFNGWWDRPDLSIALDGSNIRYQEVSAQEVKVNGAFRGPLNDFKATAASQIENLAVAGTGIPQLDVSLQLASQDALLELALTHENDFKFTASGRVASWQEPVKEITISALRIMPVKASVGPVLAAFEEIRNSAPVRLTLGPETVEVKALKLVSKSAEISLSGSLVGGDRIQTALSLKNLDLKRLPRFVDGQDKFSGILSAEANLAGTLAQPSFQAHLHIKDAAGYEFSLSEMDVSLNYSSTRAAFKADGYLRQRKVFAVSGQAGLLCSLNPFKFEPRPEGFKADIIADGLKLSTLPIPKSDHFDFDGTLSLKASAEGELSQPTFSGSLTIKDGFFFLLGESPADISFSELNLTFGYDGSRSTVQAFAYRQGQKILDLDFQAGCRLSLYPFTFRPLGKDLMVALKAQGLKLAQLPLPRETAFDYDGRLALEVDIAGDWAAPAITGQARLQEGFLAPTGKDNRDYAFSDLSVRFRYAAAEVSGSAALTRQNQKILDLSGRAGMNLSLLPFRFDLRKDDFRLDAEARDLKLSMLPIPLKEGIDFDALLTLTATVRGTLARPLVSGNLSLAEGFLTLADPDLSYETVRAQVDFSPGGIVIREFSLQGDVEGSLNLSGQISTEGFHPTAFDIRLAGDNVFIPYQKAVTARVLPELTLRGTPRRPALNGALTITEARVNLDRLAAGGPSEIQIETASPPERVRIDVAERRSAAEAILKPLAADITVSVPKNAWLKGQGVNAEISGRVNLKKEADKPPILIGSLSTVRGTYEFQGKLFKITQGNVDFIGQEELNPALDIRAETGVAKVTIIIRITGTADQMVLSLDSEPSMDRTDIISYLVFGKPASELSQQQNTSTQQAALNMTGRLAAKELKNLLGDALTLDILTLESSGDISQGSLAVGKYVTPEVFVLYRRHFKAEEPHELEVTYEINRNFSIETQLGDERTTGIDFVWEFDF